MDGIAQRPALRSALPLLLLTVCALLALPARAQARSGKQDRGSVCVGPYAPMIVAFDELKRVHFTVGDSPKIFFDREPGAVVLDNLDLHTTYTVRVFYDEKQVDSWKLRFDRLKSHRVTIWRSAGLWHMDHSASGKCTWPKGP